MNLHIERNISACSSYDLPYCVVNDDQKVIKRCKSLKEAEQIVEENRNQLLTIINGFLDAMETAHEAEDIKYYKAHIATTYAIKFINQLNKGLDLEQARKEFNLNKD